MSSRDDEAKRIVLARRARFVAAAVAGVGIACGKETSQPPMPCLSIAMNHDSGANAGPEAVAEDAGTEASAVADAGAPAATTPIADAGKPDAKPGAPVTPQPLPTSRPTACLKIAPPTRGR